MGWILSTGCPRIGRGGLCPWPPSECLRTSYATESFRCSAIEDGRITSGSHPHRTRFASERGVVACGAGPRGRDVRPPQRNVRPHSLITISGGPSPCPLPARPVWLVGDSAAGRGFRGRFAPGDIAEDRRRMRGFAGLYGTPPGCDGFRGDANRWWLAALATTGYPMEPLRGRGGSAGGGLWMNIPNSSSVRIVADSTSHPHRARFA